MITHDDAHIILEEILSYMDTLPDQELREWRRELSNDDPRDSIMKQMITTVITERDLHRILKELK